jgi:cell division protein FtsZ
MLSEHVDTLITIPNQKLVLLGDDDLTFIDACRKADEVLFQAVKGISDLITQNGIVNVDFADVKTVMSCMGRALMGTGTAKGQNRARLAAEMAVTSPLLDDISVEGATGVLINIVGGADLKMREIQEAASLVQEQAHEDANIIFGASIDDTLGECVKVTVIATGFDAAERDARMEAQSQRPSLAPQTIQSLASRPPVQSSMRPSAEIPVPSVRRPAHAQEARAMASSASRHPQPGRAYGDSAPPPSASGSAHRQAPAQAPVQQDVFVDHDWDIPAFQRKAR